MMERSRIDTDVLWELISDLERRSSECRRLASTAVDTWRNRLETKAFAYDHAAQLLADELRRQEG